MSRLRVGDIEIDGANVSIGGVSQPTPGAGGAAAAHVAGVTTTTTVTHPGGAAVVVQTTTTAPPPSTALAVAPRPASAGPLDGLLEIPGAPRALVGGGLAVAAVGVALLLTTGVFVPLAVGTGLTVLGALKQHALARRAAAALAADARELEAHAATLRPLLAEPTPARTVEWLTERSALPEATVVRTLAWMRDRGQVVEDLDTESGHWHYAAPPALPSSALALDERLALLEPPAQDR